MIKAVIKVITECSVINCTNQMAFKDLISKEPLDKLRSRETVLLLKLVETRATFETACTELGVMAVQLSEIQKLIAEKALSR